MTPNWNRWARRLRSSRLVTLIGPGGVGKTRLAVEAAARLREQHPGGAWLVELAGVTDPEGVAPAAAAALGAVTACSGRRPALGSTAELIARHLAGRSLVVVLDNCEHVIDEAAAPRPHPGRKGTRSPSRRHQPRAARRSRRDPDSRSRAGTRRLPSSSSSIVLVRSSQDSKPTARPKRSSTASAAGSTACPWPSSLPPPASEPSPWPRWPNDSTTASRCSPAAPAPRLPRQQTLRAVVDWSYDLLFEDERRLFARLSVFVGGCELEAVEAVCADDEVPSTDVLDIMSRLVDKSLVTAPTSGETRFTQLQTLWQYGTEPPRRLRRGRHGSRQARRLLPPASPRTPTNAYEVPRRPSGANA